MYLLFKDQVKAIINKNFPPIISTRFSVRDETEIYIPSMDEGVWERKRSLTNRVHILFDGMDLFEIPQTQTPKQAEWLFLQAFRAAIEDGRISITKRKEWTDNETAKKNKKRIEQKKKSNLEEAFKFALQNKETPEVTIKKIANKKVKTLKLKGGE